MQLVADLDVIPSLGPDLDSRSLGLRLSHVFRLESLGFRMMAVATGSPF